MTPEERAGKIMDNVEAGHIWGPNPYNLIVAAIREAVADEREACAKMFEGKDTSTEYVDFLGKDIAAAIRKRGQQ